MRASLARKLIPAFLLAGIIAVGSQAPANASPLLQEDDPPPTLQPECQDCHVDVANLWSHSPHAHAFDDPVFAEQWTALGEPKDCLLCHTTNFQQTTGLYSAEGVECEACHGEAVEGHPPAPVPIQADTDYCGGCHTTTLGEWRLTGHAGSAVGCSDCHDPHSQEALFEDPDEMCINCHQEDMGDYLEDLHVQKDIGCVDCHALVVPPEVLPEDGIVPTGHTFTITPATCVACHTDALHAGFSMPGYENGAAEAVMLASGESQTDVLSEALKPPPAEAAGIEELTPEQHIDTLEAAMASQRISTLFQGGVIGLTLGAVTAWVVANNLRRRDRDE